MQCSNPAFFTDCRSLAVDLPDYHAVTGTLSMSPLESTPRESEPNIELATVAVSPHDSFSDIVAAAAESESGDVTNRDDAGCQCVARCGNSGVI